MPSRAAVPHLLARLAPPLAAAAAVLAAAALLVVVLAAATAKVQAPLEVLQRAVVEVGERVGARRQVLELLKAHAAVRQRVAAAAEAALVAAAAAAAAVGGVGERKLGSAARLAHALRLEARERAVLLVEARVVLCC